jgi:hypothetical protein
MGGREGGREGGRAHLAVDVGEELNLEVAGGGRELHDKYRGAWNLP